MTETGITSRTLQICTLKDYLPTHIHNNMTPALQSPLATTEGQNQSLRSIRKLIQSVRHRFANAAGRACLRQVTAVLAGQGQIYSHSRRLDARYGGLVDVDLGGVREVRAVLLHNLNQLPRDFRRKCAIVAGLSGCGVCLSQVATVSSTTESTQAVT
jgi:hypothetical protein